MRRKRLQLSIGWLGAPQIHQEVAQYEQENPQKIEGLRVPKGTGVRHAPQTAGGHSPKGGQHQLRSNHYLKKILYISSLIMNIF